MKINFQKIIAVVVACSMAVMVCCVTVSATDSVSYLNGLSNITGNATRQFWNTVGDVITGNKSFADAKNDLANLAEEIGEESLKNLITNYPEETFDRLAFLRELMNTAVDVGDDIAEFIAELLKKNGVENETSSNIIGAGAVFAYRDGSFSNGEKRYRVYYGEYGEIGEWSTSSVPTRSVTINNIFRYEIHSGSFPGSVTYSEDKTSSGLGTTQHSTSEFYFIGDWRTESDEPVDDSELTEPDLAPPSIDDATDDELIELLNELINALNLEFPDLSSIEGLLQAILAKLGTLDSDNDNALLSQLLVAIQSLEASGGDNSEIVDCLNDIKNSLTFDNGEGVTSLSVQLQTLVDNQLTAEDFVIDEEMYKNNDEVLKLRLQQKFAFADDLKGLVDTAMTAYSNTNESPSISFTALDNEFTIDFSMFNQYIDVFRFMLAAFIYLSYALHTYRKIPSYINGGDNE